MTKRVQHHSVDIPMLSFEDVGELLDWLPAYLGRRDVAIRPGSPFQQSINRLRQVVEHGKDGRQIDQLLRADDIRDAMGLHFLLRLLRIALPRLEPVPQEYLRLFSGADITPGTVARRSRERDRLWELVVACLAIRFCDKVEFGEPDILCTFRGSTWGISCKVSYAQSGSQRVKKIVEGARQLERSEADLGIVFVNASYLLDHAAFAVASSAARRSFQSFASRASGEAELRQQLAAIRAADFTSQLCRRLERTSHGDHRWKTRGVAYLGQTTFRVQGAIVFYSYVSGFSFRELLTDEASFAEGLSISTGLEWE